MSFRFGVTDKDIPVDVAREFERLVSRLVKPDVIRSVQLVHANRMKPDSGLYHMIVLYRDGREAKVGLESYCYPPTMAVVPRMVEVARVYLRRHQPEALRDNEVADLRRKEKRKPSTVQQTAEFRALCAAAKALARGYGVREINIRGLPSRCEVDVVRIQRERWSEGSDE